MSVLFIVNGLDHPLGINMIHALTHILMNTTDEWLYIPEMILTG